MQKMHKTLPQDREFLKAVNSKFRLAVIDKPIYISQINEPAERISVRQIIVQHTRHWAVCMYVCMYIYVRKKIGIVDCGFKT